MFANDNQMRQLNQLFKGKRESTDVLAFDLAENARKGYIEGEVYVNLQRTRRQASEYGSGYFEEVTRLCLHGFLHLLGYRDDKPAAKRRMWGIQENHLRRILKGN